MRPKTTILTDSRGDGKDDVEEQRQGRGILRVVLQVAGNGEEFQVMSSGKTERIFGNSRGGARQGIRRCVGLGVIR